jgi:eukaryotic-like serine/threonine-protein kinase
VAKPAVQTFGKYQILERIATGGMAEIYKARLEGIGGFQRTFAIKRILPHLSSNAEYVAMLVDEAKVAGLLSHANIVQILDLGQVEGVWYIAMEYVHGPDLGTVIERCRSKGIELPLPHTCFIAIELLKGLEYAHHRQIMRGGRQVPLNIIHRDVSPPNILLSTQGEVKLTDFGIARASHTALETQSGVIKGRYDYMSPEQAAGAKDLDQRSDLFSVGVVLYEMLTGTHPFRADGEFATAERIRTGTYRPASEVNPGVPFQLEMIVERALRVDRTERYPNATAFKDALDKFFHDAGFLFSHHGLASYVAGLVPDFGQGEGRRDGELPAGALAVAPPPAGEFEDDAGPTKVIDKNAVLPGPPPAGEPATFGLRKDETATLVRHREALPAWEEEPETLVRQVAQVLGDSDPPTAPTASDELLPLRAASTTPPRPPSEPRARVAVREPSASWSGADPPSSPPLLYAVAAALGGVLLLLIGLMIGGAVGGFVAARSFNPLASQPTLFVQAPPGVTVSIDGATIEGSVELAADTVQVVTVHHPGLDPVRVNLTLRPGEVRVLAVSPLGAEVAPR